MSSAGILTPVVLHRGRSVYQTIAPYIPSWFHCFSFVIRALWSWCRLSQIFSFSCFLDIAYSFISGCWALHWIFLSLLGFCRLVLIVCRCLVIRRLLMEIGDRSSLSICLAWSWRLWRVCGWWKLVICLWCGCVGRVLVILCCPLMEYGGDLHFDYFCYRLLDCAWGVLRCLYLAYEKEALEVDWRLRWAFSWEDLYKGWEGIFSSVTLF